MKYINFTNKVLKVNVERKLASVCVCVCGRVYLIKKFKKKNLQSIKPSFVYMTTLKQAYCVAF